MASPIGSVSARLLIAVGDGQPTEIATGDIPIEITGDAFSRLGRVEIRANSIKTGLADLLEAAAKSLRE